MLHFNKSVRRWGSQGHCLDEVNLFHSSQALGSSLGGKSHLWLSCSQWPHGTPWTVLLHRKPLRKHLSLVVLQCQFTEIAFAKETNKITGRVNIGKDKLIPTLPEVTGATAVTVANLGWGR